MILLCGPLKKFEILNLVSWVWNSAAFLLMDLCPLEVMMIIFGLGWELRGFVV